MSWVERFWIFGARGAGPSTDREAKGGSERLEAERHPNLTVTQTSAISITQRTAKSAFKLVSTG